MAVLHFLENIRTPILDMFFSAVTYLGDEIVFLFLVLFCFWCIDKRLGYYLIIVGLAGILLNQSMKMIFQVPRPWVLDPSFTIVESARKTALGYSFPSGHTQCAFGAFGCLMMWTKNRLVRLLSMIALILVPFSRMYLGVHTPLDVSASCVLAALLLFTIYPICKAIDTKPSWLITAMIGVTILSVITVLFLCFFPFPKNIDTSCLLHAISSCSKLMGVAAALLLSAILDTRYLHFETTAKWYAQILKLMLGAVVALALKALLKIPLSVVRYENISDALRYFIIVLFAGTVWPLTFSFFSKPSITSKTEEKHDEAN